ncbi:hypothetical protein [Roseovarius aestuariivivens]|uniref:hypothetical protein n=1 Tax=Roseovarius aestuariivivens TaxID=1888910 RepID=UPI0010818193|nr:hypothetical protein [Roseovarius aestuariivivens]
MKPGLRYFAALGLCLSVTPALGETDFPVWDQHGAAKRPYIFTQQHNAVIQSDTEAPAQLIRLGYPLQVQLPGNPALWTFQPEESHHVEYLGRTMVYSPNRIAGTESILVFDLALSADAADGTEGQFTFKTEELPASLENVVPDGIYVVRFQVIDPD